MVKNTEGLEIVEDTEPTLDSTSFTVNASPMSKEEDAEQLNKTNNNSIL